MDYCPSGTFAPLANRCGDFEFPLVLDVTFDLIGEIDITAGFGSINLPGGNFNPLAVFDRGFYFDGLNNKLTITGVVINSSFTVLSWLKYEREAAVGINPIFNFDSPIPEGNPGAFNVFFESGTGVPNSL
jgi:hypothetical protein